MSTLDTAALRALADAATPGPWSVSTLSPHIIYSETDCRPVAVVVNGETPWFNEADAELIAALHPDTVRALCDAADEVERLREDVEALHGLLSAGAIGTAPGSDSHRMVLAMRDHYKRQRDASRAAHAALVTELRALRARSGYVLAADVLALLDRHAPTLTTTED